ncbi:hypothetical protein Clacol_005016 [Clathrus columnatus]|uniref:Uncharacterized protein n=1 Tax=Clathrus columnatus TaxID=1419009 RepID=A0AAV5ABD4_9AGAM|nr:hypothetical protein Clacol_005016 [Clathrus columnatus]
MSLIGEVAAIHYIIESNSKKKAARKALPGGTLHIDTTNIEDTLIVLFVAADLLCSQTGAFIAFILKDWFRPYWPPRMTQPRDGLPFSTRMLKFEAWYLAINLLAILAVLIPATFFAANRNLVVSGTTASGMPISQSAIQQGEINAGVSGIYWDFFPGKEENKILLLIIYYILTHTFSNS